VPACSPADPIAHPHARPLAGAFTRRELSVDAAAPAPAACSGRLRDVSLCAPAPESRTRVGRSTRRGSRGVSRGTRRKSRARGPARLSRSAERRRAPQPVSRETAPRSHQCGPPLQICPRGRPTRRAGENWPAGGTPHSRTTARASESCAVVRAATQRARSADRWRAARGFTWNRPRRGAATRRSDRSRGSSAATRADRAVAAVLGQRTIEDILIAQRSPSELRAAPEAGSIFSGETYRHPPADRPTFPATSGRRLVAAGVMPAPGQRAALVARAGASGATAPSGHATSSARPTCATDDRDPLVHAPPAVGSPMPNRDAPDPGAPAPDRERDAPPRCLVSPPPQRQGRRGEPPRSRPSARRGEPAALPQPDTGELRAPQLGSPSAAGRRHAKRRRVLTTPSPRRCTVADSETRRQRDTPSARGRGSCRTSPTRTRRRPAAAASARLRWALRQRRQRREHEPTPERRTIAHPVIAPLTDHAGARPRAPLGTLGASPQRNGRT
jgi:hypothetical protein